MEQALQKIEVITPHWEAVDGSLQCYERSSSRAPWKKWGEPMEVVVGQHGLAWGIGLHPTSEKGPIKREGDKKGPAGIFRLSACFGHHPSDAPHIHYIPITPTLEAVDDLHSRYYNQIVDRRLIDDPDWQSSEKMAEIDLYELGVVVDHNSPNPIPGAGSAIFIHVWRGKGRGTAGCTAMSLDHLKIICRWLDGSKHPVLVQSPSII